MATEEPEEKRTYHRGEIWDMLFRDLIEDAEPSERSLAKRYAHEGYTNTFYNIATVLFRNFFTNFSTFF